LRSIFLAGLMLLCASGQSPAQQPTSSPAPAGQTQSSQPQPTAQSGTGNSSPATQTPAAKLPEAPAPQQTPPRPPPQPKRILGIMPNYRAVSAGVRPAPASPRVAFMVATKNSFDYSAFVFVGVTSLLAEGDGAHSQLGKGVGGFWAYYWRGFLDKTDGNYMVDWAFPTITHEDERYYAKGVGSVWSRSVYAATRIVITPNYHGKNTFNTSEIVGRGVSQAVSLAYYPSSTQSLSGFSSKFGYALGRDALTNVFRELWPDISAHAFHRHAESSTP
jgi:hypothetical protein